MNYQFPSYILNSCSDNHFIDYKWNDSEITNLFDFDYGKELVRRIAQISLRAKIVLTIGVYEWTLARLGSFTDLMVPFQVTEAAWCGSINKYYIYYDEFGQDEYLGPVNGALWYGFYSMYASLFVSDNITDINNIEKYEYEDPLFYGAYNDYAEIALVNNIALALHVLPDTKPFKKWLEAVIERFVNLYTMPEDNPFANLFGYQSEKDWLGDYIAREALDPSFDYKQEDAVKLLTNYLSNVDYEKNPFLVSPEELSGRIEKPYCVIMQL